MNRKQHSRPYIKGGNVQRIENHAQFESVADEMYRAKCCPGEHESGYQANGDQVLLPDITFGIPGQISTTASTYGSEVELGTGDYLILAWCPPMTAFNGPGGNFGPDPTEAYFDTATKLGGLVSVQIKNAEFEAHPILSRDSFMAPLLGGASMSEVYSSEMQGFSTGGFVWTAAMEMGIMAPEANLVVPKYEGVLQWGQIPQKFSDGLSAGQMVELLSQIQVGSRQMQLKGAVVNNALVFESQVNPQSQGIANQHFAAEMVHVIILQRPVQSIVGGADPKYGIITKVKGNGLFFGQTEDPIANNLFRNQSHGQRVLPNHSDGLTYHPMMSVPRKIGKTVRSVASFARKHQGTIMPIVKMAAAMGGVMGQAPTEDPFKDEPQHQVLHKDYAFNLHQVKRDLVKLRARNPFLVSQDMVKTFEVELQRITRFGRFVPIGVDENADTYDRDSHRKEIQERRKLRLADLEMDDTTSVVIEPHSAAGTPGQKFPASNRMRI